MMQFCSPGGVTFVTTQPEERRQYVVVVIHKHVRPTQRRTRHTAPVVSLRHRRRQQQERPRKRRQFEPYRNNRRLEPAASFVCVFVGHRTRHDVDHSCGVGNEGPEIDQPSSDDRFAVKTDQAARPSPRQRRLQDDDDDGPRPVELGFVVGVGSAAAEVPERAETGGDDVIVAGSAHRDRGLVGGNRQAAAAGTRVRRRSPPTGSGRGRAATT